MNKYFPSISRRITETSFFLLLVVLYLLFAFFLKNLSEYKHLKTEKEQIIKNAEFWKNVTIEKPNYRDAYMEVAILEYRLGNINETKLYLEKALVLDPNFKKAKEIKKIIGE